MKEKINLIEINTTFDKEKNEKIILKYLKNHGYVVSKFKNHKVIRESVNNFVSPYCYLYKISNNAICIYAFCDYEKNKICAYEGNIISLPSERNENAEKNVENICEDMAYGLKEMINNLTENYNDITFNEKIIVYNSALFNTKYYFPEKLEKFTPGIKKGTIALTFLTPIISFLIIFKFQAERTGFILSSIPQIIAIISLILHLYSRYSKKLFATIALIFNILCFLFFVLLGIAS